MENTIENTEPNVMSPATDNDFTVAEQPKVEFMTEEEVIEKYKYNGPGPGPGPVGLESSNNTGISPENEREPVATPDPLDTTILNSRIDAAIEFIQNKTSGEKNQIKLHNAKLAIVHLRKAKETAMIAISPGTRV